MLSYAYDISWYEFDEENDVKNYEVLLCDMVHGKPALKPLYLSTSWFWYLQGFRYAAETLHVPTTRGWDSRFINGYPYITCIRTTEEEAKAREPIFREKIKPFIEDYDGIWSSYKAKLLGMYQAARDEYGLKEWDDIKKLENVQLMSLYMDFTYNIAREEAKIHMVMVEPYFYLHGLFQEVWRDIFGVEAPVDPAFNALMSGFESQGLIVDRKLWQLGRRAVALGLEDVFQTKDDDEVLKSLEQSDKGRQWLQEFRAFLNEHGWRTERIWAYDTPTWLEKPSLAIPSIKMLMAQEALSSDTERDRLVKEREATEKEVLGKVPVEQREWFTALMKAAQFAGYWSEDHGYFCDYYISSMGRWLSAEYGRRFTEAGCIDAPDDIYYLTPNEIRKAGIPMGKIDLRRYVKPRKEFWLKIEHLDPVPFYGDITKARDILKSDPTLSASTQLPIVREELKADLYGAAAAPGVIEGVARVIMDPGQLLELQEGEILVAPSTSPSWTVAFAIVSGLITNGGGALSHPVIMSREYGLPCVAGCLEATKKIKTGQRVKIDGNLGVVYILD
jgi:phosphohistidine swiveling domain-containing protein